LPDLSAWAAQLGAWGISPASAVVVYDGASSAMAAARCWWMLRAVGHSDVWVLDGGLRAAQAEGLELHREPGRSPAPQRPPYPVADWARHTVDWQEVARGGQHENTSSGAASSPGFVVLDARSPERFRGESDPYDPIAGHIPGSHNTPFNDALASDGTFLPPDRLEGWLRQVLPEENPSVVVSCGSGVTACHLALSLAVAGRQDPKLYVGSWSEWCRRDLPVACGDGGR
jgi:thiosulfate/3-mercaptopyruvate sulfurtransferase